MIKVMRGQRFLLFWVGIPLFLIGFYLLALGVLRTVGMLALPYQAEYGEGPVLDWARQISNGVLPYKPINTPPYNFSVYTPLYLALSAIFIPLIPDNPYFGGRLISLLSAVGLALLIGYASDWRGVRGRTPQGVLEEGERLTTARMLCSPVAAILLWLVSPYVFRWATFLRPDMLALFWSGVGMVLLTQRKEKGERRNDKLQTVQLIFAALCFVLAFFTKQSFFAAPLAALIYLLVTKQFRQAVWLGGAGAIMGGIVAAGLYAIAGSALIENLIAANANPFSWEAVWRFWSSFLTIAPLLILLAVLALRRRENWLWGIYLGIALVVSLSIGKAGAWENYFLEPLWILCLLVATSRPQPPSPIRRGGREGDSFPPLSMMERGVGGVRLILLLLQLLLFTRGYERLDIREEMAWLSEVRAEGAALQAAVAAIPPEMPIYSEQMGVLAELGRPVLLHSFVYTQLARQGVWDEHTLVSNLYLGRWGRAIVIQRFDAVNDPLNRDRWSRGMLDMTEEVYGLGQPVGDWLIRYSGDNTYFYFDNTPTPLENGITLLNWEAESCAAECLWWLRPVELAPNGTLRVQTLWQSATEIDRPLSISLKLFDPTGQFVTQKDGAFRNGWMGNRWAAGAVIRDEGQFLELPAPLPPGLYTIEVTLYESESGTPLATTRLPYFKVAPDPAPLPPQSDSTIRFAERFRWVGQSALPPSVQAGGNLTLSLAYQAIGWEPTRYTTFLQLLAPDGTLAAQSDFQPSYPPYAWSDGEVVTIPYTVAVPADSVAGEYRLVAGWYDSNTLVRLPVESGGDFIDIGTVLIVE